MYVLTYPFALYSVYGFVKNWKSHTFLVRFYQSKINQAVWLSFGQSFELGNVEV